jgi:hypothetical protein
MKLFLSGDAVRIISAGGLYINYQRVTKIDEVLTQATHILPNNITLIRVGKLIFTARSKARTVFARSNTEIVGSNPT